MNKSVSFVIKQLTWQSTSVTRLRQVCTFNGNRAQRHKTACQNITPLDAVYHKDCLTALHTRPWSFSRKTDTGTNDDIELESIALAELMWYMEDYKQSNHLVECILKLLDLVKLNTQRLEQLGADLSSRVTLSVLPTQLQILPKNITPFLLWRNNAWWYTTYAIETELANLPALSLKPYVHLKFNACQTLLWN